MNFGEENYEHELRLYSKDESGVLSLEKVIPIPQHLVYNTVAFGTHIPPAEPHQRQRVRIFNLDSIAEAREFYKDDRRIEQWIPKSSGGTNELGKTLDTYDIKSIKQSFYEDYRVKDTVKDIIEEAFAEIA